MSVLPGKITEICQEIFWGWRTSRAFAVKCCWQLLVTGVLREQARDRPKISDGCQIWSGELVS